jgi:hypothetical protein
LEVITRLLDRSGFTQQENDALAMLEGELAHIRQIKQDALKKSAKGDSSG